MNGKKARAIRKNIEALGKNVRDAVYENQMHNKFTRFDPKTGLGGKQLFTRKLVKTCGRNIYQQTKRTYLAAV